MRPRSKTCPWRTRLPERPSDGLRTAEPVAITPAPTRRVTALGEERLRRRNPPRLLQWTITGRFEDVTDDTRLSLGMWAPSLPLRGAAGAH
jgi:hypothetical protein